MWVRLPPRAPLFLIEDERVVGPLLSVYLVYPTLQKNERIAAPGVSQIRFQLFLSRANPWRVMLLSDPHTLVAQQYRNSFNGHTGEKQFDSECVAETVCMSVRNVCEFEEFAQSRLPAPHDAFQPPSSTPKEKRLRDFWRCFQRR